MLALAWNDELQSADLRVENGLVEDDTLATSIIISLFTDARARPSDILPNGDTDRRGWVGDALSETEGDRIGSRLWLLRRAKETKKPAAAPKATHARHSHGSSRPAWHAALMYWRHGRHAAGCSFISMSRAPAATLKTIW